jgi:hypothetical protein
MEQRASALQSRLEARRNMFLKSEQIQDGGINNSNYGSARHSAGKKPVQIPWNIIYFITQPFIITQTQEGYTYREDHKVGYVGAIKTLF